MKQSGIHTNREDLLDDTIDFSRWIKKADKKKYKIKFE